MAYWLRFPNKYLAAVDRGEKRVTVRAWRQRYEPGPGGWRPGQPLMLAFGRYDRPTLRHSTLERIDVLCLDDQGLLCGPAPAIERLVAAGYNVALLRADMATWEPQEACAIWFAGVHAPAAGCCALSERAYRCA